MMKQSKVTVTDADDGEKLHKFIRKAFPLLILSKSQCHDAFKNKQVMVNGSLAAEGVRLKVGDVVTLIRSREEAVKKREAFFPIEVLHEDDHICVAWKPSGMVLNNGDGRNFEAALRHQVTLSELPNALASPKCLYQIDNSASGLVLAAKTELVKLETIKEEMETVFRAVVHGRVGKESALQEGDEFTVEEPIKGSPAITKHRSCQGKGTYLSTISISLKSPATSNHITITHDEPTKFEALRVKEARFFSEKAESDHQLLAMLSGKPEEDQTNEVDGADSDDDEVASDLKNPAYVVGQQEFCGLMFKVSPSVMIPRPSSSTLVEAALSHLKTLPPTSVPTILDMGTGSGCLLISILHSLRSRNPMGIGFDISPEALEIAKSNVDSHNLSNSINLQILDFLHVSKINVGENTRLDAIVCNPPYLTKRQRIFTSKESTRLLEEPALALLAGDTGYEAYLSIREGLRDCNADFFNPGCKIFMEVGHGKASKVVGLFEGTWEGSWKDKRGDVRTIGGGKPLVEWRFVEVLKDKRRLERCVVFERV
ncbi:hypothetical protein HDU67_008470 [Dinochytrium kinnereticum]|nr:hypothetical protein HDU67_008470 [Dinochytrium kinnereticum]